MRWIVVVGLLGLAASPARAQFLPPIPPNLDDTLNYYLSASGYALVGEVTSEPVRQDKLFLYQKEKDPRAIYSCRIKVLEQLHGGGLPRDPKDHELTVVVVRWPDPRDEHPARVKTGEKYIFFLNWTYGTLGPHTADPWFGVQRYNEKMVELLRKMGNRPIWP